MYALLLIVLSVKYTLLFHRKLFQFELTIPAEITKISGDSSFGNVSREPGKGDSHVC